jgi:hypothetical protein
MKKCQLDEFLFFGCTNTWSSFKKTLSKKGCVLEEEYLG